MKIIWIYIQNIGMGFGIEKYTMLKMKSGGKTTEGTELPNHESIRTLEEKESNKYFGKLEVNITKKAEMKEKKNYFIKTIKISKPGSAGKI